jgi:hypothetical protein
MGLEASRDVSAFFFTMEREKVFAKDGLEKQDKDEEAIHDDLPFLPIEKRNHFNRL